MTTVTDDIRARLVRDLDEWFAGNGPERARDAEKLAAFLQQRGWV